MLLLDTVALNLTISETGIIYEFYYLAFKRRESHKERFDLIDLLVFIMKEEMQTMKEKKMKTMINQNLELKE